MPYFTEAIAEENMQPDDGSSPCMTHPFVFQRKFGTKLSRKYPRLILLLKTYQYGYEPKQASALTRDQIQRALQLPPENESHEWSLKKCAMSLSYCGGIRGMELRSLTFGSLDQDEEGLWVTFKQSKTQAVETKRFLIPFNNERPDLCFARPIMEYKQLLLESLPDLRPEDPLFFKPLKNGKFSRQVIGKQKLSEIGKDVASRLGLPNPGTYTEHGWRRASATEAANQVTLRPLKALLIDHVALNFELYEAMMDPDHFPVNLKKEILSSSKYRAPLLWI